MEVLMKVLDNSVVTALGRDIRSVNLLPILMSRYEVAMPPAVIDECRDYEYGALLPLFASATIVDDARVQKIASVLKRWRPNLGKGECSAIAASLIMTSEGKRNYLILDDGVARKCAREAGSLPGIVEILGKKVDIKLAGTIGLVLHLHEKGLISDKDKQNVGYDLETSSFRVSNDLLKLLR